MPMFKYNCARNRKLEEWKRDLAKGDRVTIANEAFIKIYGSDNKY